MVPARKRPRGRARAWLAAFAVGLGGLAALAPGAGAVPRDFWGISPQATPSPEQFQRLAQGGVDSVRIPISWATVQPAPGVTDFHTIDPLVAGATQAGIDVLPFVYNAPEWAVPAAPVPGSGGTFSGPRTLPVKTGAQRAAWSAFLQLVVGRYGPGGSFWQESPALPARPVRTWQIWNEQNFKYFVVRPSPAEYGKLLKVSHTAIRSVDPRAKLILGGMFARPKEARYRKRPPQAYFATDFLDRLYRTTPGIKRKFAGVALHPYTPSYQELTPDIEEFRAVLKRHRDAGKALWITEIGWSSLPRPGNDAFSKGPSGQVKQLKGAFRLFERNQRAWKLRRIYWFSVDDQPAACNFCGGTGLFADGFVPKRSWFAFVRFTGGRAG